MHLQIYRYIGLLRLRLPQFFEDCKVCDFGSLDVNGTNKGHFKDCTYIGIDIGPGPNVDHISLAHEFREYKDAYFDTVLSTDMLEHDKHWAKSIVRMYELLRPGGLMLLTCAGRHRGEHGTVGHSAESSPLTIQIPGWNSYYRNLEVSDIRGVLNLETLFSDYEISEVYVHYWGADLQFWGIKK